MCVCGNRVEYGDGDLHGGGGLWLPNVAHPQPQPQLSVIILCIDGADGDNAQPVTVNCKYNNIIIILYYYIL